VCALLDGEIGAHEHLAPEVEDGAVAALQQLEQHVRVLRGRAQGVLICTVVEDELERERAGCSPLLLGPGSLDVGHLPNLDLLLRALFPASSPRICCTLLLAAHVGAGQEHRAQRHEPRRTDHGFAGALL